MKKSTSEQQPQPKIVKYVDSGNNGIKSESLSRYALGYVLQGHKNVYYGDRRYKISRGEIFYMGVGHHYVENIGGENGEFEQIIFYYTPSEMQRVLSYLNMTFGLHITNRHACEKCLGREHVSMPAGNTMKCFFQNCNSYLRTEFFDNGDVADTLKMTELVYMIISLDDCCLKSKILHNADSARENFDQIIYDHIFKDVSIEELASASNRSLTSFKKEFKRRFIIPPHRWYIRQRLAHSRMLLVSTSKSVAEIGNDCAFPNTSHFIKLFKREYKVTPANYRSAHLRQQWKEKYAKKPQGRVGIKRENSELAAEKVPATASGQN